MLLLFIVSLLAAIAFHRTASAKGYPPLPFAFRPVVLAVVFIGIATVSSAFGVFLSHYLGTSEATLHLCNLVISFALIAVYFYLLAKLWRQLKSLPTRV